MMKSVLSILFLVLLHPTVIASKDDDTIPSIIIGVDVANVPVKMPLIGAGTWQYNDTIAYQAVCQAFAAGYTFVDTAFGYGNQQGVGRAILDCWQGSREDLFVMTKIPGGLDATQVYAAHKQNLLQLGLDYVDHLMTHFPSDWKQTKAMPELRQEEWLALEKIYYAGEARSIGVSHYCTQHMDDILEVATVTPSVNQVEYHVGSQDVDSVISKCQEMGTTFMSFSPLCGPCEYEPSDSLINGDLVTEIGAKYGKSGPQVSLRYIVQQALQEGSAMGSVIPKSNNMKHIQSNRDIFDFELSDEDMELLRDATKPPPEAGDCDVP
jgi:diketogulonate reductase-like aldo/keto reductase